MYDTIIMRRSRQNRRFQVSPVTKGVAEELGLLSALSHSTLSRYKDLVLKRHVTSHWFFLLPRAQSNTMLNFPGRSHVEEPKHFTGGYCRTNTKSLQSPNSSDAPYKGGPGNFYLNRFAT